MAANNYLFYGDNLQVLRKSVKDETVDLCYIDPPFNSQRDYNQIYNNIGEEDQAQAQAFTDIADHLREARFWTLNHLCGGGEKGIRVQGPEWTVILAGRGSSRRTPERIAAIRKFHPSWHRR
jgi:DNA modification methylase